MPVKRSHYEETLAEYSHPSAVVELLKQYRPYLEMLPSMRRPDESLITLPLPIVRLRHAPASPQTWHLGHAPMTNSSLTRIPCDIGILMCDPDWKVKTGVEILIFIHRPQEDLSDLLGRWRQSQVMLDKEYEWITPPRYQHILCEGADKVSPLVVLFEETPERIKRGLKGARIPCVIQQFEPEQIEGLEPIVEQAPTQDLTAEDSYH